VNWGLGREGWKTINNVWSRCEKGGRNEEQEKKEGRGKQRMGGVGMEQVITRKQWRNGIIHNIKKGGAMANTKKKDLCSRWGLLAAVTGDRGGGNSKTRSLKKNSKIRERKRRKRKSTRGTMGRTEHV